MSDEPEAGSIPKVVVTISGGCLQSVYSTHPIEVQLLDHDNYENQGDDDGEEWVDSDEIEKQLTQGMQNYF